MAITESILFMKLSGHLGKQIVFKQYGDKTVVTKYPDMSKRVLSPAQLRINEIMRRANYEAKRILASEALREEAIVRLKTTSNKLYTALIKEYFQNVLNEKKAASGTDGDDPIPERPSL